MHELAVCQQMLSQVESIAREHQARRVERIVVQAGPLSGIEPHLLRQAFSLARAGTLAAAAELQIETGPVRVRCRDCGAENEVAPNRLLCGRCETWQVEIVSGEELLLKTVDLSDLPPSTGEETDNMRSERHV